MGLFLGVVRVGDNEATPLPRLRLPQTEPFAHLQVQTLEAPGAWLLRARNASPLDPPAVDTGTLWAVWDGTWLERGWSFRPVSVREENLRALLQAPEAGLRETKGWFALALYDVADRTLLLATDWMALRPLFYRWDADRQTLFFGTLMAPLAPGEPDLPGLLEYFFLNYPLHHRTHHQNLARLPAGHYLYLKPGAPPQIRPYEDHRQRLVETEIRPQIGRKQVVEAFIETTRALAQDTRTPGLLFTGGFDSRVVLAALQSDPRYQVQAVTFGDPASRNATAAQRVARRAGAHFALLDPNPEFRRNFARWARLTVQATDGLESVTKAQYLWGLHSLDPRPAVLLSGTGGSELFRQTGVLGTIYSPLLARLLESSDDLALEHLAHLPQAQWLHLDFFGASALQGLRQDLAPLLARPPEQRPAFFHGFNLTELFPRYFENEMRVEQLYTVKRYPFLDLDFVELVFSSAALSPLRAHLFKKSPLAPLKRLRFYTQVLRHTLPALAHLETDRGIRPDYATSLWGFLRSALAYWRFKRTKAIGEYRFGEWLEHFPLDEAWPCEPPVRRDSLVQALRQIRGTPLPFPYGASRALTFCLWQSLLQGS